jgi:SAM-dependent methyltransferase
MTKIKAITDDDMATNSNVYDEYHRLQMVDGWFKGEKERHYKQMLELPKFTGKPISGTDCLDVGCGSGDLSAHLRSMGARKYTGIDIYKPSIIRARENYPTETFIYGDFLQVLLEEVFHYAFCSGGLTVKLQSDNYDYLESTIAKMWKLTSIGIVFNFLTDDDIDPDPDLFFYNKERVLEMCKMIAPNAEIISKTTVGIAEEHIYMYRK